MYIRTTHTPTHRDTDRRAVISARAPETVIARARYAEHNYAALVGEFNSSLARPSRKNFEILSVRGVTNAASRSQPIYMYMLQNTLLLLYYYYY